MEQREQTVLFVCTGNYYRSRYAEYIFNARRPAGLAWVAESRGFAPSSLNPGPVSREAAGRLREQGEAPAIFRNPVRLTTADLDQATLVVMLDEDEHRPYMQERFPSWEQNVRYWRVTDLWGLTPDQALGMIDREVEALIAELSSQNG